MGTNLLDADFAESMREIRISGNQVAGNQENRISGESVQKTENGKARRKISRGKILW